MMGVHLGQRRFFEARRSTLPADRSLPMLVDKHRRIYQAIRDRNSHIAQRAMLDHLRDAERQVEHEVGESDTLPRQSPARRREPRG